MGRIIPNENSWIAYSPTEPANLAAPTDAELAAVTAVWTKQIVSINASSSGNTVPTPDIGTMFETSVPGTSSAQFTMDVYRDDDPVKDAPFQTLKRGTKGVVYISRFGGTGPGGRPEADQGIEVWPIQVTSRGSAPLASNTAQMATITCAVPTEPEEDALVVAAAP